MLNQIKQNLRWILAAIAACVVSFGIGWMSKTPEQIVKIEEKIVEKVVEKVTETEKTKSEQKKVTKVITKPDGTTETTTTEVVSDTSEKIAEKEKESDKISEKDSVAKTTPTDTWRPNYSIGVEASTDFPDLDLMYRVTAGYRLFGNLWLSGGYHFQHKEVSVGLRVDF